MDRPFLKTVLTIYIFTTIPNFYYWLNKTNSWKMLSDTKQPYQPSIYDKNTVVMYFLFVYKKKIIALQLKYHFRTSLISRYITFLWAANSQKITSSPYKQKATPPPINSTLTNTYFTIQGIAVVLQGEGLLLSPCGLNVGKDCSC